MFTCLSEKLHALFYGTFVKCRRRSLWLTEFNEGKKKDVMLIFLLKHNDELELYLRTTYGINKLEFVVVGWLISSQNKILHTIN